MSDMPRIDVEQAFADCVEEMGGQVLDRTLSDAEKRFSNADYFFPQDNVVADLKCLREDIMSKPEFARQASEMHARWVAEGRVAPPRTSRVVLNPRELPDECAREFVELFKKRLEFSTIKKANKQLRETKKRLGAADAEGLLLLANDGNVSRMVANRATRPT